MKMAEWKIYPKVPAAFKSCVLTKKTQDLLTEIVSAVGDIDAESLYLKQSLEKTMRGRMLFSPKAMNSALKPIMDNRGWKPCKHKFQYADNGLGFYEVDFMKDRVACEVQLGKYAFMSDNVLKLELYNKVLGLSDLGVLVVPTKCLQTKMSTGPGCFHQIVKRLDDLNYQVPLVVMGIQ